ncbi:hypothetical protein BDFG_08737 [Blastomyces dermatitidis ATCC 26199]|nr:hypothetical protein BDFG_08737 [Blastomyces dermatitidis ATCC 26199]
MTTERVRVQHLYNCCQNFKAKLNSVYKILLQQHEATGRTPPDDSDNYKRSKATAVCFELETTQDKFLEALTSSSVKVYFDYLERTHKESIKPASSLNNYWRVFKSLYTKKTDKTLDESESTARDCRWYKNVVIKRWGLRRLPKHKLSGTKDDVYRVLRFHWERSLQRSMLMRSSVSMSRLVYSCPLSPDLGPGKRKRLPLNDDRGLLVSKRAKSATSRRASAAVQETSSPDQTNLSDVNMSDSSHDGLEDASEHSPLTKESDIDNDTGDEDDEDEDEDDISFADSGYDSVSPTNKPDGDFIEDVTDDEYDAGPEETGALLWRHISFHIIRYSQPGRPNLLLAQITLLHTKG